MTSRHAIACCEFDEGRMHVREWFLIALAMSLVETSASRTHEDVPFALGGNR
jgi:hypothetical protein